MNIFMLQKKQLYKILRLKLFQVYYLIKKEFSYIPKMYELRQTACLKLH